MRSRPVGNVQTLKWSQMNNPTELSCRGRSKRKLTKAISICGECGMFYKLKHNHMNINIPG